MLSILAWDIETKAKNACLHDTHGHQELSATRPFSQICRSIYLSSRERSKEIMLFNEPCVMQLPFLVRISEVDLIIALESVIACFEVDTQLSSK